MNDTKRIKELRRARERMKRQMETCPEEFNRLLKKSGIGTVFPICRV